ncbi:MAG: 4'-phosphopantetheinyl transferase superfamily protein [Deltaproteobacteria bacterium]|nr:4'-phosphopantetheinyl transferase superfamily protein [Deltaproteobacteria bacterium]MBW2013509.1 4'-phosphopantetheinyl transferase superfamily protein [Deltaproteobacteria bacterium]MBW2320978.1 4'-phosphopantetheinyl transferase superfamily protein [Deltaproteobacteria bacterium]
MEIIPNPIPYTPYPIIYPVILAAPDKIQQLTGRKKVSFLSKHARKALEISAKKSHVQLGNLKKDEKGVPLPFNGNYWSLTHKSKYVAAVIASTPIGIDIEKIRPCSKALFRKTAHDREWELSDTDSFILFFRYWTSKESVLKASGTGIRDLSKCRIVGIIDNNHLIIDYRNQKWLIEHFYFDEHIVSIVKNDFHVEWTNQMRT